MKLSKIFLLLGFLLITNTVVFAQYDDDDKAQSRKGSQKKEKVSSGKIKQSSGVKNSKSRNDLFRSSVNKTTHMSKKEQTKMMSKKDQTKSARYKSNRGKLQNDNTEKRMKKSERQSYKINSGKKPFLKKAEGYVKPKNRAIQRKSRRKSSELHKRQRNIKNKYDTNYTPVERGKKKKKDKLKAFYLPDWMRFK